MKKRLVAGAVLLGKANYRLTVSLALLVTDLQLILRQGRDQSASSSLKPPARPCFIGP